MDSTNIFMPINLWIAFGANAITELFIWTHLLETIGFIIDPTVKYYHT